ncbi:MAG TPA: hypothetical protein VFS05_09430 [Gemmatimonadaceae bacterium]|nr:hypothetical protein [Gemmatimonadaceae bacterium]
MPVQSQKPVAEEPIGIVISRGKRDEPVPALTAYVWGPAPEAQQERPEPRAA